MKISASVYSNKQKELTELVKELDSYHVDYLHVDCNDDLEVFDDIMKIRQVSNTPIDLHVISRSPEKFYNGIKNTGVEMVTFQYENLPKGYTFPSDINSSLGLAITNSTPISVFSEYNNVCSFVLFMTTKPGVSGGKFADITYERIKEFQKFFPSKSVHVDGGVNDEIAKELMKLGVSCSVSGSFLVKASQLGEALLKLKSRLNSLSYYVNDFMLKPSQLPVIL
jgi:pentose-5-phosphate-3-epimerase